MRILGIDPGLRTTGFGVLDVEGPALRYVASGVIQTAQAEQGNLPARLKVLFDGIRELQARYQPDVAAAVHNAWLKTIEDGVHTYDIYKEGISKEKVGTKEFAQAVAARLGQLPEKFKPVSYNAAPSQTVEEETHAAAPVKKETVGIDVFIHYPPGQTEALGRTLEGLTPEGLKLIMISNRGVKVYPGGLKDTITTDNWRCRFQSAEDGAPVTHKQILDLLTRVEAAGLDFIKTENLCTFDGKPGFSLGQGQ